MTNINDPKRKIVRCPTCSTVSHHKIPKGELFEIFLFWLPVQRYRCYSCFNKFYVKG